jgi:UDP-hydrolysing UDP-N-acetyl-D-glucosamine 2-epimerase
MKKILGITGIRSDYDLMSALFKKLMKESDVNFQLIVGGAHLSPAYGNTVESIKADGIKILGTIESLIHSDSVSSRIKSASILLQGAVDIVANWKPDLIIYAGDREETWIGAMLGTYLEIPTVHFYGGDHTLSGHVDNPIRHAVTKLSSAHFVVNEEHKKRVQSLGEDEKRIFVVGNLSLDNFVNHKKLTDEEMCNSLGLQKMPQKYAIVIFHPDPSEKEIADTIFENILLGLKAQGIFAFVGYPNTDPSNQKIINVIEKMQSDKNFFFYKNLNRDTFISLYKNCSFIAGNSSSGIAEAASIPVPALNVGLRQVGRMAGHNVIFTDSKKESISDALKKITSPEFLNSIKDMKNPYGDGKSCDKALQFIKSENFELMRLKTEDPLYV